MRRGARLPVTIHPSLYLKQPSWHLQIFMLFWLQIRPTSTIFTSNLLAMSKASAHANFLRPSGSCLPSASLITASANCFFLSIQVFPKIPSGSVQAEIRACCELKRLDGHRSTQIYRRVTMALCGAGAVTAGMLAAGDSNGLRPGPGGFAPSRRQDLSALVRLFTAPQLL